MLHLLNPRRKRRKSRKAIRRRAKARARRCGRPSRAFMRKTIKGYLKRHGKGKASRARAMRYMWKRWKGSR